MAASSNVSLICLVIFFLIPIKGTPTNNSLSTFISNASAPEPRLLFLPPLFETNVHKTLEQSIQFDLLDLALNLYLVTHSTVAVECVPQEEEDTSTSLTISWNRTGVLRRNHSLPVYSTICCACGCGCGCADCFALSLSLSLSLAWCTNLCL